MECVGDPPVICDAFHSGIRFVRVGENRIRHEWVELANVPEAIDDLFPAAGGVKRQLSVRPHLEQIMALPTSSPKTSPKPRHTSGKLPLPPPIEDEEEGDSESRDRASSS